MKTGKRILVGVLTSIMAITLLAGMPMGKDGVVNAARRTLKNPSRDSDGVVTWDCVYFGSYPQSDATGKTKEPIKWRVLSANENDAFLVADRNLDYQLYNEFSCDVTWETCTIRSWLNGYGSNSNVWLRDYSNNNFIDDAFTASEQAAIKVTMLENEDHFLFNTPGGRNTEDKLFLLSMLEVTNPVYGFSPDLDTEDKARKRTNTAYAEAAYAEAEDAAGRAWWLRSPGVYEHCAAVVSPSGKVAWYGPSVGDYKYMVCPALHLNLEATDVWSYAGTVNSNGESKECQHENTEVRERKEATCKDVGHTGGTYCSDCGAKIKGENIPANGQHQWNNGIITKQATEKEDAVKTFTCTVCGETRTESVPGTSDLVNIPATVQAVTDASIAKQSSEDVKGAVFNALLARTTKLTNKTITLKWKKVSKADGYKIYGNRCGKKNHYKLIKDVGKNNTSYTQKKLKKGTYYKYVVAAYKIVDGKKVTIAVSKTIHATTTGGKYGVAKSVKVNKSKVTLKKGKKFTIKAAEVKKDKTIKRHRKIAYESSNTKVATVSKKGVIKAKTKGTCYIYVYAQNGVYKRVKVTVK